MRLARLLLLAALCLAPATVAAQTVAAGRVQPIIDGRSTTGPEIFGTVGLLDTATLTVVCTGTLVTPRVVVTAGHCFFDEDGFEIAATSYVVAFGSLDLTSPPNADHLVTVVSGGPHPDYGIGPRGDETPSGLDPTERDIGHLLLARDLVEVTPVGLATVTQTEEIADVGAVLTIAGYGVTDLNTLAFGVLMQATATVVATIPNELLLAPTNPTQGDTCYGDSGGPVYGALDGRRVLLALTSRGRLDSPLECGAGGIYTNVAFHRTYLAGATGDESLAPPPRRSSGRCSLEVGASGSGSLVATLALALASVARRRARAVRGC